MSARPLYLHGNHQSAIRVGLDGVALLVEQAGRAAGRYPLRLLTRVVSTGAVCWETSALMALMDGGITLTFASTRKGVRGYLFPNKPVRFSVDDELRQLMALEDGWQKLLDWERAAYRRQILLLEKRLPVELPDLCSESVAEILQTRAEEYLDSKSIDWLRNRFQTWTRSVVVETLSEQGITPLNFRDWFPGAQDTSVVNYFSGIVFWDLEVLVYQVCKGISRRGGKQARVESVRYRKLMYRAYHQRQPRIGKLLNSELTRFRVWLTPAVNE